MLRTLSSYVALKGTSEVPPVESLPIPGAQSVPTGRFVGAFGIRGTLKLFQEVRQNAASNVSIRRVDVKIEIDAGTTNPMVTSERLASSKALHLGSLCVDLQGHLRGLLNVSNPTSLSQAIAYNPSLLNVIWAEPDFQHLKVICWHHPTRTNPRLQLGAIASSEAVNSISIQNHYLPVDLKLRFF